MANIVSFDMSPCTVVADRDISLFVQRSSMSWIEEPQADKGYSANGLAVRQGPLTGCDPCGSVLVVVFRTKSLLGEYLQGTVGYRSIRGKGAFYRLRRMKLLVIERRMSNSWTVETDDESYRLYCACATGRRGVCIIECQHET